MKTFEDMYPEIAKRVHAALRGELDHEELAQEALCQAFEGYLSCARRKHEVTAANLAYTAVTAARFGRRFCTSSVDDMSRTRKPCYHGTRKRESTKRKYAVPKDSPGADTSALEHSARVRMLGMSAWSIYSAREDTIERAADWKDFVGSLNPIQQAIVKHLEDGFRVKEIAAKLDLRIMHVYYQLRSIAAEYRAVCES